MRKAFIIGGKRTPIGNFMGILHQFKGIELAALTIIDTIKKFKLHHHDIEEIILGNAISTGMGQNPSKQVSMLSKANHKAICYSINEGSASGYKAVILAKNSIITNQTNFIIAGGFESLSNVPHIIKDSRPGVKYGDTICQDPISVDNAIDTNLKVVRGYIADQISQENKIDKSLHDEYARLSYQRAIDASNLKKFDFEMSSIKFKAADPSVQDELYQNFNPKSLEYSKPIYTKNLSKGAVSYFNSSRFADGACTIAIASDVYCTNHNIKPLAEIISNVTLGGDSMSLIETSLKAVNKALKDAQLTKDMIGYWEIHEDFASTVLLLMKNLDLHYSKVNIHGGSIALGNPLGMTGARLILSMVNILKTYNQTFGCVIIPHEDGSVSAMILRKCN